VTTLRAGGATDVGLVRDHNEDRYLADERLFAVADGVGGHKAGEVASQTAVETLQREFTEPTTDGLVDAVKTANRTVWNLAEANREQRGMGTTLTALALVDDDGEPVLGDEAAGAPQVVGQLVAGDGEEIGLELPAVVEIGQAVEKTDKRFLHHVLAGRAITDAALDKRQQPAFVTSDQPLPGARVALANLLHKQTVAVGRHGGIHWMNSWIGNYRRERHAVAISKPTV